MPSLLHESLLLLVRDRPDLVATLLTDLLGVPVPPFTEARLAEAALHELVPVEYHADAVVLFVEGKPVFGTMDTGSWRSATTTLASTSRIPG